MKTTLVIAALALLVQLAAAPPILAQAAAAQSAGRSAPSPLAPSEIVAAAPAVDWRPIAAADLLVMTLAPDAKGAARRVVIQLMPPPFSQGWVGNIRKLAAVHWWDGLSVNRVQDNYVAQWGDADGDDKAKARALPSGLAVMPETEYSMVSGDLDPLVKAWIEHDTIGSPLPNHPGIVNDAYAGFSTDWKGWPVASDVAHVWPIHCYGMVGVGRNLSPDTGSGAELYTVIGHAPRHLDRNIALVGRVIEGIEQLSSLPRGTGDLGFYKTAAERTGVVSIRLASELPVSEQPRFEYLSTESASFARYADARANRRDPFFIRPAGGADICNIPVPVRRVRVAG